MKYKHIFGPVPSRRLGASLGVDLVPHKVCTFNCIYCECGKTTLQTYKRDEYVNTEEVIDELKYFLSNNKAPDFITFSGAGEPTLNIALGKIVDFIKDHFPGIQLAVITNGSLFHLAEVREAILKTDLVLPSLDSAIESSLHEIDRPVKNFDIETYIDGLIKFRREYAGKIWLEIMIIPGLNTDKANLNALKEAIIKINPDRIQLNTLDRPGVIENIKAATHEELSNIMELWNLKNVEIIAKTGQSTNKLFQEDIENLIIETISRRPCTIEDIAELSGLHVNEVNKYMRKLMNSGILKTTRQDRGVFYFLDKNAAE